MDIKTNNMTPKEKAIQLVDNFRLNVEDYEGSGLNLFQAKQCALIAVDETLNVIPYLIMDTHKGEVYFYENEERNYWEDVKQEIEKL